MKYKYCLIISQYCYSHHTFIVEIDDDYEKKCKRLIEDLEDFKRENKRDYHYGDIVLFNKENIYSRYNINDEGDIYFINSNSINALLDECVYYYKSFKHNRYVKNEMKERTIKHHSYIDIEKIVKKHFEIM